MKLTIFTLLLLASALAASAEDDWAKDSWKKGFACISDHLAKNGTYDGVLVDQKSGSIWILNASRSAGQAASAELYRLEDADCKDETSFLEAGSGIVVPYIACRHRDRASMVKSEQLSFMPRENPKDGESEYLVERKELSPMGNTISTKELRAPKGNCRRLEGEDFFNTYLRFHEILAEIDPPRIKVRGKVLRVVHNRELFANPVDPDAGAAVVTGKLVETHGRYLDANTIKRYANGKRSFTVYFDGADRARVSECSDATLIIKSNIDFFPEEIFPNSRILSFHCADGKDIRNDRREKDDRAVNSAQ